ncbi:hypothetical protein [Spartinivicinus poritis]|uniref:Uncharacterized protein n=1 Tax=Spartinivicinus poritis TaxID=2994640 RepID=A0ABT5UHG5_9GAMM|nr:hypothetical protein [Spartinivicinus sp. A2-2]MDE1465816.1 hypothetical protein [Spartinivicinus sp. A2-2]
MGSNTTNSNTISFDTCNPCDDTLFGIAEKLARDESLVVAEKVCGIGKAEIGDNRSNDDDSFAQPQSLKLRGTFGPDQIPPIDASKIDSGLLDTDRIPSLSADTITSGEFNIDRIPSLSANKIGSGQFRPNQIPGLSANKINSGQFSSHRIPGLHASKIISGQFDAERLPSLNGDRIQDGAICSNHIKNLQIVDSHIKSVSGSKIADSSISDAQIKELHSAKLYERVPNSLEIEDQSEPGIRAGRLLLNHSDDAIHAPPSRLLVSKANPTTSSTDPNNFPQNYIFTHSALDLWLRTPNTNPTPGAEPPSPLPAIHASHIFGTLPNNTISPDIISFPPHTEVRTIQSQTVLVSPVSTHRTLSVGSVSFNPAFTHPPFIIAMLVSSVDINGQTLSPNQLGSLDLRAVGANVSSFRLYVRHWQHINLHSVVIRYLAIAPP